MSDLLQQGAQWLDEQRSTLLASPVTYRREGTHAEFFATYGRTEFEADDETGMRVQAHVTDFLISAGSFAPVFGHPRPGDQITAGPVVYEVMNLTAEGCWRWCDPYRYTMRIHAREVGEPS